MKRLLLFLIVPALVAAFALTSDTALSDDSDEEIYLALGDSLAVGVGASDAPPFPSASKAYVPLFHQFLLAEEDDDMALVNLGVGGETTGSLIAGGQLAAALTEIETGDVEVITLDIGGNDVFALVGTPDDPGPCFGGLTAACAAAIPITFATFSANFDFILNELRTADDDTPIIVMTYYNPLPGCFLAPLAPLGDIVLEGGGPLPAGLNDLIRAIAATHDAEVADTFGKLGAADLVGGFDCLHPDDDGYAIIADEFEDAFEDDEDAFEDE